MADVSSHEPDSQTVRVGILLTQEPDDIGEWLADASAFDAAGADALWVDSALQQKWDVLALTAALSVVTFRSRLVAALPDSSRPAAALAHSLDTIGRLSHGRLAVIANPRQYDELDLHTTSVAGAFRGLPDEPGTFEGPGEADEVERWVSTPPPQGRSAWQAALADAGARGIGGLVVPADPLLLDILRNPGEPGGRRDLRLAQG